MLCKINVRERNYRDSAALCVRLAHNRKVGNFKRGSYLGVAQLVERVPWEHEAAGSRPATQTSRERWYCSTSLLGLTPEIKNTEAHSFGLNKTFYEVKKERKFRLQLGW